MDVLAPAAITGLCAQIAALKLLPRTGWLQRGVNPAESIAEHCFGVALLALVFAGAIPGIDRGKLLAIALLHDLAEAALGDLPAAARRHLRPDVKLAAERSALAELVVALPDADQFLALWEEYAQASSAEARLVKALDRLELLAQALAYERAGNRALDEFWQGAEDGWEFPQVRAAAADLLAQRPRS